jgi:hypothetical protein
LIERNAKISSHLIPSISTKINRRIYLTLNGFDDVKHRNSSVGIYDLAAGGNLLFLFAGTFTAN